MKHSITLSLLLAALFATLGCEKEDPFNSQKITGKGEITTLSIELDPFQSVELGGVADLVITLGEEQAITLKAQQNIIDAMTWEVSAGILSIGLDEGVQLENHEPIIFEIHVEQLASLLHNGVGNVTLSGNSCEEFEIDHRGIGEITAYDLPVCRCMVKSSGTGNTRVLVNEYLEVDISSIGNVYYRGNPQISSTETGLGELINDNK